jgi:hypothetical protein
MNECLQKYNHREIHVFPLIFITIVILVQSHVAGVPGPGNGSVGVFAIRESSIYSTFS